MLNTSKNKNPLAPQALLNLIGTGTIIKGDIQCNGDIRIDGSVKGKMEVRQKLVIGESGIVQGDVDAANVSVSGVITGNIKCQETAIFHATSQVTGDIHTKQIIIEQGAIFNGQCKMGAESLRSKPIQKEGSHEPQQA
jgi:cytoskeletal protein CcmA (bactofilin family)